MPYSMFRGNSLPRNKINNELLGVEVNFLHEISILPCSISRFPGCFNLSLLMRCLMLWHFAVLQWRATLTHTCLSQVCVRWSKKEKKSGCSWHIWSNRILWFIYRESQYISLFVPKAVLERCYYDASLLAVKRFCNRSPNIQKSKFDNQTTPNFHPPIFTWSYWPDKSVPASPSLLLVVQSSKPPDPGNF